MIPKSYCAEAGPQISGWYLAVLIELMLFVVGMRGSEESLSGHAQPFRDSSVLDFCSESIADGTVCFLSLQVCVLCYV